MAKTIYNIGICDDILYWQNELIRMCSKKCNDIGICPEFFKFNSGETLLEFEDRLDILFLDEEMSQITGQMIKETYENENKDTMIIFVTSHEEILYDSFGKNVYGFLNKPLNEIDLSKVLDRLFKKLEKKSHLIYFDPVKGVIKILCRNILYIEAEGSYSKIIQKDGSSIIIRKNIGDMEQEIEYKYLVRIHKSYIVNLDQNCKIISDSITTEDGKKIIVARRRKKAVLNLYSEIVSERVNTLWNM